LNSLGSIPDTLRRLGIANGTLWAAARALAVVSKGRWRVHRYYFVAQPVPDAPQIAPGRAAAIAIRLVGPDDPLVEQFPRPRQVIAGRFRMQAHCLAAEKDGRFVGFIWIKETQYPEDEVRCLYQLDPAGRPVWDFDVHVEPAFRHGRTFIRLWDAANAWMREHGYRWTISRISAFNPESLAAHRRLGTVRVGSAIFLRSGAMQLALLDRPPFVHLGWRENQTPRLHLRAPTTDPH
jgi:acetyltransferase (GNAT) family protein